MKHTVSQHDDDDNGSGIVGKVMMLGVFVPNSLETGRLEERCQRRPTDSWLTTALEETCVGAGMRYMYRIHVSSPYLHCKDVTQGCGIRLCLVDTLDSRAEI